MEQIIDKDGLFRTTAKMVGRKLNLSNVEMQKLIDTFTVVFAEYDVVTHKYEISTNVCGNAELVKSYMESKKLEGIADSSINAYIGALRKFYLYTGMDFKMVDTNTIRKYLLDYEKSVSKTTVNNSRRYLNNFFQFLEDEKYIEKNPCKPIKKIKEDQKIKRFYTDLEMESMRDSCYTKRELALIDLLLSTGIRIDEIHKIKLKEINWDEKTILIHGKGNKERLVPISIRCKKHLQDYLNNRDASNSEYLFVSERSPYKKIGKDAVNKIVKSIGQRCGLTDISVHCFRRWFASDLNKKGVDPTVIQEILGHASFETTNKHYLSKSDKKIRYLHEVFAS